MLTPAISATARVAIIVCFFIVINLDELYIFLIICMI